MKTRKVNIQYLVLWKKVPVEKLAVYVALFPTKGGVPIVKTWVDLVLFKVTPTHAGFVGESADE